MILLFETIWVVLVVIFVLALISATVCTLAYFVIKPREAFLDMSLVFWLIVRWFKPKLAYVKSLINL